ncbi:lipopolysaccharide biosynthesis protein [Methanococcoides sp. SA1]|nr:lipopolysaccharide biosynthesis protein [Methanococcoides sp. SA1]
MSLKDKTLKGLAWVAITTLITRFLVFGTKIYLAKILVPSDFGLITIAFIAITGLNLFRDLGIGAALIYNEDDAKYTKANTAFLIIPLISIILYIVAHTSAHYVALAFGNAEVESIFKTLAITIPITAIGTVHATLLNKEMEFKKKFIPEAIPAIIFTIVAIYMAYGGYGVWSLVYAQILFATTSNVLYWVVCSWRPSLKFDKETISELIRYGKYILGANILIFAITNVDNVIIGRLLGMELLGLYSLAYTIATFPATKITHLIGTVMFPVYSKLHNNQNNLSHAYFKTLKYVSIMSIPASLGILILAPEFVQIVLGDKWMPAVPSLQILCVFGLLQSISSTFEPVFQATGNPKILRDMSLLKLVSFLILIFPFTKSYGILGTALAITIPSFFIAYIQMWMVSKIIKRSTFSILKILLNSCLSSLVMILFILVIKNLFEITTTYHLLLIIAIGILVYVPISMLLEKELFNSIKNDFL